MDNRRILIINNPIARAGKSQRLLSGAGALSDRFTCEIASVADAPRLLALMAGDSSASVLVFGGDGTLNRLLPDLVASRLPIAIFPAGTVNDFALQMGMTDDWEDLARLIDQNKRRAVDLVSVNGQPFAAYASIGLGARTSALASRLRAIEAPLRHIAPTILAPLNSLATIFFDSRYLRRLRFEAKGNTQDILTPGLYVTNLPRLNRKIKLIEGAGTQDGTFGAYALRSRGKMDLARTVYALQARKDIAAISNRVSVITASRLRISSEDETTFDVYGDGEYLTRTREAEFEVMPKAIEVFSP